jgi:hypothetical protein
MMCVRVFGSLSGQSVNAGRARYYVFFQSQESKDRHEGLE